MNNTLFKINGYIMRPSWSDEQRCNEHGTWHDSHFKGVNVIGVDFLLKANADYCLSAIKNKCRLVFP